MAIKAKVIPLKPTGLYDPTRDGITQGILSAYKTCKQLARDVLDGWTTRRPSFPLTYGSLTHYVLNQAYDNVLMHQDRTVPSEKQVIRWLEDARRIWMHEHPIHDERQDEIFEESIMKNAAIMPSYFRYWKTDFTKRHWLEIENTFKIPIAVKLIDGRVVQTFLRGKIDGAFTRPKSDKPKAPRLMETKTRTQIDEAMLIDTMPLNTQTGLYTLALQAKTGIDPVEVELNIVRKTLLRQGKREDHAHYEARIRADVQSRMDWYFVRMKMSIGPKDIVRMRRNLDSLVRDFLSWWYGLTPHYPNDNSCNLYHRPCDMLKKCADGETKDLFKRKTLFSELEEE